MFKKVAMALLLFFIALFVFSQNKEVKNPTGYSVACYDKAGRDVARGKNWTIHQCLLFVSRP